MTPCNGEQWVEKWDVTEAGQEPLPSAVRVTLDLWLGSGKEEPAEEPQRYIAVITFPR